jgi:trehalose 6-phosphate synthase complex regulatory subunit
LASWGSPTDIVMTTPKKLIDILNTLIEDKRNLVYVMSSRMPEELENLFRMVPGLGLIAENGSFLNEAGTDDWIELADLEHVKSWKPAVKNLLKYYVERMEGSKVEERHSALIFNYAECSDKAAMSKQAGECANHINDACHSQNISAIPIENGLCIAALDVNKGTATALISDNLEYHATEKGVSMPEFLLVVGDSREDEYVFNWAQQLEKKEAIRDVCTVTLGTRNTGASATLTQGVTGKSCPSLTMRLLTYAGVLSMLRKLAAS